MISALFTVLWASDSEEYCGMSAESHNSETGRDSRRQETGL
jgi:hypothetical protein